LPTGKIARTVVVDERLLQVVVVESKCGAGDYVGASMDGAAAAVM
jgi:hypothetical protein